MLGTSAVDAYLIRLNIDSLKVLNLYFWCVDSGDVLGNVFDHKSDVIYITISMTINKLFFKLIINSTSKVWDTRSV